MIVFAVCISSIAACSSSKKMMKDAHVLEKGGLNVEAYDKYNYIYSNSSNAEARVGMKRMAQQILNDKMQIAQMKCMSENYEQALIAFEDALAFQRSNSSLELTGATMLEHSGKECKGRYIEMLYTDAEIFVRNDDYENAHSLIRKIFAIDRNNQKAKYLDMMCDILPHYNAGVLAMDKGLYRNAYVYFAEVCKIDAGFRDALRLRDETLLKGSFALVYRMTMNRSVSDVMEEALAAMIKGKLLAADNPFMELLERDDLSAIYREQQETLAPEFESEKGAEAGKLKRARFILSGEMVNWEYNVSPESKSKCDCYATFRINSEKVNCYQLTQSASAKATYKYKLLDAETGKLYKSDVITFQDSDAGKYFRYEIMKKLSLISPNGMRDHEVNLAGLQNPEINPLISEEDMATKMYEFVTTKVAVAMSAFRP